MPNIPPAMLAQLKNMSPAQQAALARQYGFELPGGGAFEAPNPRHWTVLGRTDAGFTCPKAAVDEEVQRLLAEGELDDQRRH